MVFRLAAGTVRSMVGFAGRVTYCGECGHKMCVQYKGGTQYICNHLKQQTGAPVCQRIGGDAIDDQVVAWLFEALSAADIDITAEALTATDKEHAQVIAARSQSVERLRYQTQLAERQFLKSDPDNRLVTGELERRWEQSLRDLRSAEEQLDQDMSQALVFAIPADLLEMLKDVGTRLPDIWNQGLLKTAQKKSLLRSLIDKVVIHRIAPDQIQLRVVWRGGATTASTVRVTVGSFALLSDAATMEKTIEQMARSGHSDKEIASHLTSQGYRSPMANAVLNSTVRLVRLRKRILAKAYQSRRRNVPGFLTARQLAERLGISRWWINDRIRNGTINAVKDPKAKCYLFPDTPELLTEMTAILVQFRNSVSSKGLSR